MGSGWHPRLAHAKTARAGHLVALACVALGVFAVPPATWAAGAARSTDEPRLTILDGEAAIVEGARRFNAVEGQPLPGRVLIETASGARLLRIEWPDGQVVDLGPGTRAMLSPPRVGGRDRTAAALYLQQGWAKQSSPDRATCEGLLSPQLEVTPFTGSVVNFVGPTESWLFVESGSVTVVERGLDKPSRIALRAGSAYTRLGPEKGVVAARPTSQAMQRVPRAFRDPLPLRFAAMKSRAVKLQPLPAPTYAQLQPWLSAESAVREGFIPRFDELLRDRQFRHDLAAHLRDHREWQPILYPPPPPKPPEAKASGPANADRIRPPASTRP